MKTKMGKQLWVVYFSFLSEWQLSNYEHFVSKSQHKVTGANSHICTVSFKEREDAEEFCRNFATEFHGGIIVKVTRWYEVRETFQTPEEFLEFSEKENKQREIELQ